jgi:hypothetical protein
MLDFVEQYFSSRRPAYYVTSILIATDQRQPQLISLWFESLVLIQLEDLLPTLQIYSSDGRLVLPSECLYRRGLEQAKPT